MKRIFQPHGDSDLWVKDGILYAKLLGTWNQEAALEFSSRFKQQAQSLTDRPWAHLVYLEDWDLCAIDVIPVITDLVSWCIDHNLVRAAQIYCESMIKKQFIDLMVVEQMGQFKRVSLDNEQDALNWLLEEMKAFPS
ncbi:hypothetical protein [Alteromonas facilis]|uniref:hypothetical protein n=1 Tax=Alteromonas facilis TaxID=2048004 RepID=UPI000F5D2F20|nr:hypothetical protein [Alteromonas facilis]